eukprot:6338423-Amphidinium_carterae.2
MCRLRVEPLMAERGQSRLVSGAWYTRRILLPCPCFANGAVANKWMLLFLQSILAHEQSCSEST